MAVELVLTVIARDRPGLIKDLSETIAMHGGNWVDSSMARLGGEFAGILRVSIVEAKSDALEAALGKLQERGIAVTVRKGGKVDQGRAGRLVRLGLTGIDHPGIVQRISTTLSSLRINIDELETRVFTGSMSGQEMFEAKAGIVLPDDVEEAKLRATLEALAKDLMVDIELAEG